MTTKVVGSQAPEVRTFAALELRAENGGSDEPYTELTGRAVPYGSWTDTGWYKEQFTKGAFSKSIREAAQRLPLLLWHDKRSLPVGVSREWEERDDGLWCTWDIDADDQLAQDAARKADKLMLTGLSVGFQTIENGTKREWDDNDMLWVTRSEARLLEVSLVPTPAYAGAQVQLVRSAEQGRTGVRRSAEFEAWQSYLDGIRRG